MKLSTIFELLLIFLIIAFAASKVIESKNEIKWKKSLLGKSAAKKLPKERQSTPNRYCSCSNLTCNCCRDISLPMVPVSGPGCASLKYMQGDSMLVTMSFGDRVLRNVTISGKKPKPICMNLPGGISKFCGRVYGISRDSDQIKACLGLELRDLDDVEAALRVSCFKFGPNGLNVEPGKPVPADEDDGEDDDDDDDGFELPSDDDDEDDDNDDDDVFGLGDDDDFENTVEAGESPSQYKPTEKVRPSTVNQPLESYIPTILQLSTEKVYTSPQQISTDKVVYMSTINQYIEDQEQQHAEHPDQETATAENKPPPIANLYVPTTQQFASTDRVFMPGNLSTVANPSQSTSNMEAVTSSSIGISVMQFLAAEEATVDDSKELDIQATEVTPGSKYNEVDSDTKTTINDVRYEFSSAPSTLLPTKVNNLSTVHQVLSTTHPTIFTTDHTKLNKQQNKIKDDSDDNEFQDVAGNAANVFEEVEEHSSKGNETTAEDANTVVVLTDSDEDSDEGGIVLGGQNHQSISSENEQNENDNDTAAEIDDDEGGDDDEFRKIGTHSKKGTNMTTGATSLPVPQRMHPGREHKRMNLPPLFSQKPEISSFWSSGGHLYKIRTSATMLDQASASFLPNINRLGRLNLFVPAAEMNSRVSGVSASVSSSVPQTDFAFLHRFKLAKNRNQTDRSRRNHKYLRIDYPSASESTSRFR